MAPATSEGGLGQALIGEKITVNHVTVSVKELLGEGTISRRFIYIYIIFTYMYTYIFPRLIYAFVLSLVFFQ
jgi:hypothetical protein